MSSLASLLLQAAISLLLLVQANPNLSQSLREQAIAIANQAIKTATGQFTGGHNDTQAGTSSPHSVEDVRTSHVTAEGYLSIEPSSISVKTGESVTLHAYYQPPMPVCPAGLSCAQVMPARIAVDATYASDNAAVARVESYSSKRPCTVYGGCPNDNVSVLGVTAGTAMITASYRSGSNTEPFVAQAKVIVSGNTTVQ